MSDRVIIPEVVEDESRLPADLLALKRLAYILDEAVPIPGTRKRVGLDAAIGLIPGVGDVVGALISATILIGAVRHRVPLRKIGRMFVNIAIDLVLGSIPVLGDVFDFLWEENIANLDILMRHRDRARGPRSIGRILAIGTIAVLALLMLSFGILIAMILLVAWLIHNRWRP